MKVAVGGSETCRKVTNPINYAMMASNLTKATLNQNTTEERLSNHTISIFGPLNMYATFYCLQGLSWFFLCGCVYQRRYQVIKISM